MPAPSPLHAPTRARRPPLLPRSEGGTSIEDLAEKYPEKIIKIPVDIRQGITDDQVRPQDRSTDRPQGRPGLDEGAVGKGCLCAKRGPRNACSRWWRDFKGVCRFGSRSSGGSNTKKELQHHEEKQELRQPQQALRPGPTCPAHRPPPSGDAHGPRPGGHGRPRGGGGADPRAVPHV